MKYEAIRRQVLSALLEARDMGLIHGTSGNIAVRAPGEAVIAISPSGRPYDSMTPEEIALVDLDGKWIDGPYKPSSETPMHTGVYRARPDVGATVHVHSLYSTVMAMSGEELLPSTPPQAEFAPIRTVPFALPGSAELARLVAEALGEKGKAVLLQNHGTFCCGRNIRSALEGAVYVEEAAQVAFYAKLLGTFRPLPPEAVEQIRSMLENNRAV